MEPWWGQAVTTSMLVWLCCYHRVAAVYSDRFACGVHNVNVKTVAGGTDVQPNEIAWQAYLEITMPDKIELNRCGGVLVDDDVVLTAAHCVGKATKIEVILGEHDLSEPDETQVWRAVAKYVHIHPGYGKRTPEDLDVAVIIMDRRVIWDQYPYIIPICFHRQQQQTPIVNLPAVVSGWGQLQNGSSSHILQKAELTLQPQELCTYAYGKSFTENMLCAKTSDGKVTACSGDSGGPLALKSPLGSNYNLVGLVSFGKQCGRHDFPSVFAKTSAIYDWFEKVTSNKNLPPATSSLETRKWTNTSICAAEGKDDEIDKVCGSNDRYQLAFLPDVSEIDECRARCASTRGCNFFTWKRYIANVPLNTSCALYRECRVRVSCAIECQASLTGHRDPPLQSACCEFFHHGLRCTVQDEHLLGVTENVPDMASCQEHCQAKESCEHFNYDEKSQKCLLLAECGNQIVCNDNCWSGPRLPSLESCLPRANVSTGNTQMAVLLLGGLRRPLKQAESWPCELNVPDIPQVVWGPGAAVLGENVYLCGGKDGDTYYDSCSVLGRPGLVWQTGPSMNEKRMLFTLNNVGGILVAAGGSNGVTDLDSVEIYEHTNSDYAYAFRASWLLADWKLSSPRRDHCAAAVSESELVIAGGHNSYDAMSLVESYNVVTGALTSLPALTQPRYGFACTFEGASNSLIVAGGTDSGKSFFSLVEKLSLSTGTWSRLAALPTPHITHGLAILNGALAVFGGMNNGSYLDTVEILTGDDWQVGRLQLARDAHAMVMLPCP